MYEVLSKSGLTPPQTRELPNRIDALAATGTYRRHRAADDVRLIEAAYRAVRGDDPKV